MKRKFSTAQTFILPDWNAESKKVFHTASSLEFAFYYAVFFKSRQGLFTHICIRRERGERALESRGEKGDQPRERERK